MCILGYERINERGSDPVGGEMTVTEMLKWVVVEYPLVAATGDDEKGFRVFDLRQGEVSILAEGPDLHEVIQTAKREWDRSKQ